VNELDLGKEKINRLIVKFSVPCVISMVVAALYNIVDQIFIGWSEAGAFGNAATNIVYPFTVLALGLALLIGDGAASGFSIARGMNEKKRADKFVGNGLAVLVSISVIHLTLCVQLNTMVLIRPAFLHPRMQDHINLEGNCLNWHLAKPGLCLTKLFISVIQ